MIDKDTLDIALAFIFGVICILVLMKLHEYKEEVSKFKGPEETKIDISHLVKTLELDMKYAKEIECPFEEIDQKINQINDIIISYYSFTKPGTHYCHNGGKDEM